MEETMGTELCFTSAYHRQWDGQMEVVNRSLRNLLRALSPDKPKQYVYCCRIMSLLSTDLLIELLSAVLLKLSMGKTRWCFGFGSYS